MAVQIPRLQPLQQSQDLPKNPRLEIPSPNNNNIIGDRVKTISGIASKAGQIHEQYENEVIETLGNEINNEYSEWADSKSRDLSKVQGDPSDSFDEYENAESDFLAEIEKKHAGASSRVKRNLALKLDSIRGRQSSRINKQRFAQVENYQAQVFKVTKQRNKNDLVNSASDIVPGDMDSYDSFKSAEQDLKTTILKRALKNKGATQVAEGTAGALVYQGIDGDEVHVTLDPVTKAGMEAELADSYKTTVEILVASDQTAKAKNFYENYKSKLDPKVRVSLEKKFKSEGEKQDAYLEFDRIKHLALDKQFAAIDKVKNKKLIPKLEELIDSHNRRRLNAEKRVEDGNLELLTGELMKLEKGGKMPKKVVDLDNNDVFKKTWDKLSPKGKQTVLDEIEQPKGSTAQAISEISNLIYGDSNNDISSMSHAQLSGYLSGLSKADRKYYRGIIDKIKTESTAEFRSSLSSTEKFIKESLLTHGMIERNERTGKIQGENEILMIGVRNKILAMYKDYKIPPDPAKMNAFVEEVVLKIKKREVLNPDKYLQKRRGLQKKRAPLKLSRASQKKYWDEYKATHPDVKPKDQGFIDYMYKREEKR